MSAMSMGKVFGPPRRKSTGNGDEGEALEKRIKLGLLATADATVSSVELKTMCAVPVHQERSSCRNLYEVDSENDMSDFQVVGC